MNDSSLLHDYPRLCEALIDKLLNLLGGDEQNQFFSLQGGPGDATTLDADVVAEEFHLISSGSVT